MQNLIECEKTGVFSVKKHGIKCCTRAPVSGPASNPSAGHSARHARVKGEGITSVTNHESVFSTFCSFQEIQRKTPWKICPSPIF